MLEELLETPIIDKSVSDLMIVSKTFALEIGGAFFAINLAYNYVVHAFKKNPAFLDYSAVARSILILFLIGGFELFVYPIKELIGAAINVFDIADWDNASLISNQLNTATNSSKQAVQDPGMTDVFNVLFNFFSNIYVSVSTAFFTAGAACVYFIVRIFLIIIIKALYIVGPLALLLSLVPGWRDNFSAWLSAFIGTSCVLVSQNILLKLQIVFLQNAYNGIWNNTSNAATVSAPMSTIFNVTIIALHISVFWFTKQWIAGGSAGQVFSNAINAASTAAGARMGAAIPNRKGSESSTVDNAADVFKNRS